MNAAAKVLEKMHPNPEGLDTTAAANPANSEKYADLASGETMKVSRATLSLPDESSDSFMGTDAGSLDSQALVWEAKNKVSVKEVPKPALIDDHDIVIKVTGSTVCGSGE
jgi:hypothetical protein